MAGIAGIEVGLPATIDEVDAEWMTSVFRTSGALSEAGSVTSLSVEPFAVGVGFLSLLYRVTPSYAGDAAGAPETVIVKMVTDMETQRGIADALQFYQRELRFYREVAPTVGFGTATMHAAIMGEGTTDFVLVMEDLSNLRALDQLEGVSAEDALVSAATMAEFHAIHWGSDLNDLATTFLPFDNPIYRAALPDVFASGWDTCKAEAGDLLTPEVIAFGDRFGELVPFFIEQVGHGDDMTLMHGDWRADNLMMNDDDGTLTVVDFQISGTGVGIYDLGYFMSQSLEPEVRREASSSIVDRYLETLDGAGITYDRARMMRIFKLTTAWCLIYPVSSFASFDELPEHTQALARAFLRRSVTAMLDEDALSLLPSA
ncbi:MAG: phosphotransferase [Actinomycetota bacterium]